jgi:hypothetical protein
MRKLDKAEILAIEYKNWQDGFIPAVNHPNYNSSANQFYYDIIANLIWIQKGLCAYTEYMMQDYEKCAPANWRNNKFDRFDFAGELDHYDPTLKNIQGWLWDNFFLIDSDVNSKKVKGSKKPNSLLKPDKPDFEPSYYLEYDVSIHQFIPNKLRTFDEQALILHDINTLGLNWQPTVERRAKYLNEIINDVRYGEVTFENAYNKLIQFFTAFNLSKNYMLK